MEKFHKIKTAISEKINKKIAILAGGIVILGVVALLVFGGDRTLIPVSSDGERWGFINRSGEFIINPQFEDADFFSDGLARVRSNGRIGYINRRGDFAIPATFKAGTEFSDGLAFVVADGEHPTAIDRNGNVVFVLQTALFVSRFSEGLALFVTEDGQHGFVDRSGNIAINPQFERAMPFSGNFARIWQGGDIGFIDRTGRIVINPQFRAVQNFYETMAAFSDGRQWGFINTRGSFAINPQFDFVGRFSERLAPVQQGRSWGFIDRNGRLVINPQFDEASHFSDGLAAVRQGNRWGFINRDGQFEINPQFDAAGNFYRGRAIVRGADRWGIINKDGRYVVNPQFRRVKLAPTTELAFIESDFYDASEFIALILDRRDGDSFDGISATSSLDQLSSHPQYGAGLNARNDHFADFSRRMRVTDEIGISLVRVNFSTPIYRWVNTGSRDWWGNPIRNQRFNFNATANAVTYQFFFDGRAAERRGAIMTALRTEIEQRYGQTMRRLNYQGREVYALFQGDDNFSFAVDMSNAVLHVGFCEVHITRRFPEASQE